MLNRDFRDILSEFIAADVRFLEGTSIDGVDFDRAWTQRITISLAGLDVPILGREHLLINERATGRPQDLADTARLEASTERPEEA